MRRGSGTQTLRQRIGLALLAGSLTLAAPSSAVDVFAPETARGEALLENGKPQLEARLLVSHDPELRAGILFDLAPGWHLYWRNPGESGIAPSLDIEAKGFRVGPVAWPAPEIFEEQAGEGTLTTYGYAGQVLLSVPLEPEAATDDPRAEGSPGLGASREAIVRANPRVLICRTECVPVSLALASPIDPDPAGEPQSEIDLLFAAARAGVPASAEELGLEIRAHWVSQAPDVDETSRIELSLRACAESDPLCEAPHPDLSPVSFMPFEDQPFELSGLRVLRGAGTRGGDRLEMEALRLEESLEERLEARRGDRLRGLVQLRDPEGRTRPVELDLEIGRGGVETAAAIARSAAVAPVAPAAEMSATPPAAAPLPTAPAATAGRWIQIALLALLGGLILNGMPCVLPVLAIKIVAIADLSSKDPREVRRLGLAYTGGVLGSMALLAGLVLALRAAGHSVGWGFQLQEPIFVAGISALLVAFALNLFGVFEIDLGQGRLAAIGQQGSPLRRSVFEGLLAVVLATPCTAPFLGTAVGFAFAAPGLGILAIFLAIGLGLALPFLAVSFVPGLARFLPRSGPWMLKLRAALGFSLLATVVWLLWVMGQSGGSDAVVGMLAVLLLLAFLLWAHGAAQPLHSPWLGRASAVLITALAFTGFNWIDLEARPGLDPSIGSADSAASAESTASTAARGAEGWAPWSEQAVREALAQGRPAFVVFTADWCITCKLNEKRVLERAVIREAFATRGYALFKADWTRRDETIRARLAAFGRAGVPLYLVYSPEDPQNPRILSELLSQDEVVLALAESTSRS